MSDARIPSVKVAVLVEGTQIAVFSFWRVQRSVDDWEITAALVDEQTKQAVRACLLACVAEVNNGFWEGNEGVFEELNPQRTESLPFTEE